MKQILDTPSASDPLFDLAELWRERYKERARGGAVSLAGYRFQLLVTIRDTVKAFLQGHVDKPSVFVEAVSDICQRLPSGEVLFTQVKITGGSVAGALEELWAIHMLVAREMPNLLRTLRYRILCAHWTLKDIPAAIDRWVPPEDVQNEELAIFKKMIEPSTDANPMDELLDLVANGLNAQWPYTKVLSWLGRLTNLPQGAMDFWEDLQVLRKEGLVRSNTKLYMWAPVDRPPLTPRHGQVLVQDKPKLIHLREGYFAERKLYADLTVDAQNWIESLTRQPESLSGAHVLWFGGRSGCGKSVAMLHVLSRLHQQGIGPIIWLGSGVSRLAEAVRRAPSFAGQNQIVLIAVDDPYAPHTEGDDRVWRDALSEMETLQNQGQARLPIFVCCGPSKQAERLRQDFAGEVAVHVLTLDPVIVDRKELESWYLTRTGKHPPTTGGGDLLLVQLFFEWQEGKSLKAFAKSFRKKILELDPSRHLFEIILRILAANRLYTGYSSAALSKNLSPTQRDAFRELIREHHFAIDEDADRAGVWLTHPHLADVIFDAWLPAGSQPHERSAVISQTILDGLNYAEHAREQTSMLWALARQVRGEDHVQQRVEVDNPKLFISEVYTAWRQQTGNQLPFSHFPAWITLQCRIDGLAIEPNPIDEAFERLLPGNRDETGFRLTCHKLLQNWASLTPSQRDVALLRMVNILKMAKDWFEWSFIAEDMAIKIDNPDICELVSAHLEANGAGSFRMLTGLLLKRDTRPNADWMFTSAIEWIERNIGEHETGEVISATLRRRDLGLRFTAVSALAIEWCRRFSTDPSVDRVFRRLLKLPHTPPIVKTIAGMVFDYLVESGLAPESSFPLGSLLRTQNLHKIGDSKVGQEKLSDKATALGLKWISQFPGDAGMPYVADQLLRLGPSSLADEDWRRIALLSLSRLTSQLSCRDADYSLNSIARRRHLLKAEEEELFSKMLRDWLQDAEKMISKSLSKRRFREVIKPLASSLPLSAHLGDEVILLKLESAAKKFRKDAPEGVRASFDRFVSNIRVNRAWPDLQSSTLALKRIGVFSEAGSFVGKVQKLLVADPPASYEDVAGVMDAASDAAKQALDVQDIKTAGFLLAKMLPLGSRAGIPTAELLTRRLMASEDMLIDARCGFITECDDWIEKGMWPSLREACDTLERVGIETPLTLSKLVEDDIVPNATRLDLSLEFSEQLIDAIPMRAGLFLAPLLVLGIQSKDLSLTDRVRNSVNRFLEEPRVSDTVKVGFAKRVAKLWKGQVPDDVRIIFESLELQSPWVEADAHSDAMPDPAALKRHLTLVRRLLENGAPVRAGHILAPMLPLAERTMDKAILAETMEATSLMLRHPDMAPENLDGFIRKSLSYRWLDSNLRDTVFVNLGIGAPNLWTSIKQMPPTVSEEVLDFNLLACERHLENSWYRGPSTILAAALPLTSWIDDSSFLLRSMTLTRRFLTHPDFNQRKIDHFRKTCLDLLAKGCWRCTETGTSVLMEIGLLKLNEDLADTEKQ